MAKNGHFWGSSQKPQFPGFPKNGQNGDILIFGYFGQKWVFCEKGYFWVF
jgi:hypothetical protein